MTWRFLLKHGEMFASVAPLASSAGDMSRHKHMCPVLLLAGTTDTYVPFADMVATRDGLVAEWSLTNRECHVLIARFDSARIDTVHISPCLLFSLCGSAVRVLWVWCGPFQQCNDSFAQPCKNTETCVSCGDNRLSLVHTCTSPGFRMIMFVLVRCACSRGGARGPRLPVDAVEQCRWWHTGDVPVHSA